MDKGFFNRDAEIVARELLGKIITRRIGDKEKKAQIVETEAYFDENDPASRACQRGDLRDTMMMEAGTILVYGVHNSWLINFVTGSNGEASAVLVRAVEPLNFESNCNGPGLLTKALDIDKRLHKQNIINNDEIKIISNIKQDKENSLADKNDELSSVLVNNKNSGGGNNFEIVESFRIGVREDLEKPLRFYIKDNKWVSRK